MKLGVMQSVLPDRNDSEWFRLAQDLDFAGVEPVLSRSDLQDKSAARLRQLRQAIQQTGLMVQSLCFGAYQGLLAKPKPTDAAISEMLTGIDWAAELGAQVVLVPFFFEGELKSPQDFASAVVGFQTLCTHAQTRGVTVTYEGTYNAEMCHRLAAAVASPAFGIYFDLANVVWLGMDGPAEICALGPLIKQVHMKETRVGPGDCHPGEGRVKYAQSAQALHQIGYDAWLVLETPAADVAQIARDIAFTRKFFTHA